MTKWYNEVADMKITTIVSALNISIGRLQSFGPCPACNAEKRGSSDNRKPLGLTPNKLGFMCHKCKITGDSLDLLSLSIGGGKFKELSNNQKDAVKSFCGGQGWIRKTSTTQAKHISDVHNAFKSPPQPKIQKSNYTGIFAFDKNNVTVYKQQLYGVDGKAVYEYLTKNRCIDPKVLKDADIGVVWEEKNGVKNYWITIPLKDKDGDVVNFKYRSVPPAKKSYRHCPARPLPLYGGELLDKSNDSVIITEGEFDVLAMRSYGFSNVVSSCAGAQSNWTEEWLDILEQYKSFILLYDDDQAGDEGADKLADKLGRYRCFRSKLQGYNDPNEALIDGLAGDDVEEYLSNFISYVDPRLQRVDHFEQELEDLINNPYKSRGTTTGSYMLDECVGGIRAGLWVITGDTGAGKSTWANWLCYEQAKMDIPVMITSFENRPIGTVQKLLRMHVGGDFTKVNIATRKQAMLDLGNMPIYIMDHYGEMDRAKVIESVRFASRRHGVKIALIDHLGFLTTPKNQGEDERLLIESTVRELCQIAVQDGITIMLICHPNNTSVYQNRRVKISDLKGASAIRQDAHIGVVVERGEGSNTPITNLYFDKVRSEFGKAGSTCTMAFDPLSCIYAEKWEQTPSGSSNINAILPRN